MNWFWRPTWELCLKKPQSAAYFFLCPQFFWCNDCYVSAVIYLRNMNFAINKQAHTEPFKAMPRQSISRCWHKRWNTTNLTRDWNENYHNWRGRIAAVINYVRDSLDLLCEELPSQWAGLSNYIAPVVIETEEQMILITATKFWRLCHANLPNFCMRLTPFYG